MFNLSIILVDDHSLFRLGIEHHLKSLGYSGKIYHADNGLDALTIISEVHIDLIFMDIRMPELDGLETTKEIRKINKDIKIVAISNYSDEYSVTQMFEAGANGYALKTIPKSEIEKIIQTVVLENRIFISEKIKNLLSKKLNPRFEKLTDREKEIVRLICEQLSNKKIASILQVTEKAIEGHRARIMLKTHCQNTAGLAMFAVQTGLII